MKKKAEYKLTEIFGKDFPMMSLENFTLVPHLSLAIDREHPFPALSMTRCFPSPAEQRGPWWAFQSPPTEARSLHWDSPPPHNSPIWRCWTRLMVRLKQTFPKDQKCGVWARTSHFNITGPGRLLNAYGGDAPQWTKKVKFSVLETNGLFV